MRDEAEVIVSGGRMVDEKRQRADKERRTCSFCACASKTISKWQVNQLSFSVLSSYQQIKKIP